MIDKALLLITAQLNQYILPIIGGDEVVLGNVALNDLPDQAAIKDKVVVSIVNVEEESALKNNGTYIKQGFGAKIHQPPIYLNLYVLFCAHYPSAYDTALSRLSKVIEFFQQRKSFDIHTAQPLPGFLDPNSMEDADLSITLDLFTLSFEQVNHLWGSLGGKQMPFVLYKLRLVKIFDNRIIKEVPLIQEIQSELNAL